MTSRWEYWQSVPAVFALLVYQPAVNGLRDRHCLLSAVLPSGSSREHGKCFHALCFAGYYLPNTIAMMLTLLVHEKLAIHIQMIGMRTGGGERILGPGLTFGIAISLGVAFLTGMCGMRSLLTIYLPLAGMEVLYWIFSVLFRGVLFRGGTTHKGEKEERIISRKSLRQRGWLSLLTFGYTGAAFLGGLSPLSIHMGTTRNLRHGPAKLLREVLPALLECIGFNGSSIVIRVLLVLLQWYPLWFWQWRCCLPRVAMKKLEEGYIRSATGEETAGLPPPNGQQYTGRQRHLILFFWMSLLLPFDGSKLSTTTETVPRCFYVSWIIMAFSVAVLWDRIRR